MLCAFGTEIILLMYVLQIPGTAHQAIATLPLRHMLSFVDMLATAPQEVLYSASPILSPTACCSATSCRCPMLKHLPPPLPLPLLSKCARAL